MAPITAALVSLSAFLSALFGGLLATRAIGHVGLVIAFGAGIRIGAAYDRTADPREWPAPDQAQSVVAPGRRAWRIASVWLRRS